MLAIAPSMTPAHRIVEIACATIGSGCRRAVARGTPASRRSHPIPRLMSGPSRQMLDTWAALRLAPYTRHHAGEVVSMSGRLSLFNIVFVGDNFPVTSMSASDFEFRGRRFKEQVRLGPVLQATTREVQLTLLPDRFQVSVMEPDDLEKQALGVIEVANAFREFVGSRTINAVGHNVQAEYSSLEQANGMMNDLVNKDQAAAIFGLSEAPKALLTLVSKIGNEDVLRLNLAGKLGEPPNQKMGIDFNFEFNRDLGGLDLDFAVAELPASLENAVHILERFDARYGQGAPA